MPTLSPDTKFRVSIVVAISAILGAVGFGFSLQRGLSKIETQFGGIENKFDKVSTRLDSFEKVMTEQWNMPAAAEWALRLKLANPQLGIPDPRDPSKLLSY